MPNPSLSQATAVGPQTEIEIELRDLSNALVNIDEALRSHHLRLSPIRRPVSADDIKNVSMPPEAMFSPHGEAIRQLRKKAQEIEQFAAHLGDNLAI